MTSLWKGGNGVGREWKCAIETGSESGGNPQYEQENEWKRVGQIPACHTLWKLVKYLVVCTANMCLCVCIWEFRIVVKSERQRDERRHAKAKAKLRINMLKKNCNTLNIFYVNDRKKWNNSIKYECKQQKKSQTETGKRRRNRVDETNADRMEANDLINVRDDKNPHSHSRYVDVWHVYVCVCVSGVWVWVCVCIYRSLYGIHSLLKEEKMRHFGTSFTVGCLVWLA